MRAKVDKMSRARKAFLFFSEDYPAEPWRKQFTKIIKMNLLIQLNKENIAYKTYKFKDFILIIPSRGKADDKKTSQPKDSAPQSCLNRQRATPSNCFLSSRMAVILTALMRVFTPKICLQHEVHLKKQS